MYITRTDKNSVYLTSGKLSVIMYIPKSTYIASEIANYDGTLTITNYIEKPVKGKHMLFPVVSRTLKLKDGVDKNKKINVTRYVKVEFEPKDSSVNDVAVMLRFATG